MPKVPGIKNNNGVVVEPDIWDIPKFQGEPNIVHGIFIMNNGLMQDETISAGGFDPILKGKGLGKFKKGYIKKNDKPPVSVFDISSRDFKLLTFGKFKHNLIDPKDSPPNHVLVEFQIYKPIQEGIIQDCITGEYIFQRNAAKVITNLQKRTVGYTIFHDYLPTAVSDELGKILVISEEELLKNGYIENLNTGVFYSPKLKDNSVYPIGHYHKYKNMIYPLLEYCTKDEKIRFGAESKTYLLTEGKQYTFGCELEYSTLWIPDHLLLKYNMECMRDGSLNKHVEGNVGGPEIVTGVLKGDAGLSHLQKICTELSKRGTIDKQCGVHIHIGGFERNDNFVLFSYLLGLKLQKEIFSMMPPSRKGNEYCKLLDNLGFKFNPTDTTTEFRMKKDAYCKTLFSYLSVKNHQGRNYNSKRQHPMGPKLNYDHSTPRYCWLNLIPTAFNTRENESYTIEFRPLGASSNFNKIYKWIKVCMAFVSYVENNQRDIMYNDMITLNDIIIAAFPKTGQSLIEYVMDRKSKFNKAVTPGTALMEENELQEKTDKNMKVRDLLCV